MSSRAFAALCLLFLVLAAAAAVAGERFTDNGDGTVTDHELGLMWSRSDNLGDIDWHQAVKWARFTFPYSLEKHYENWRLPTMRELESLVVRESWYKGYETDCGRRVLITPEIELSCGWLWSSEEKSITARLYNFDHGYGYMDRKSKKRGLRALPVRDLE